MIAAHDISVVVQGPVLGKPGSGYSVIERVLSSIRHYLPGAEIIFSTWADSQGLDHLMPDVLVSSNDPGGMRFRAQHTFENNINRQIRSTKAGLIQASRPYTLKLRSDLILCGTSFRAYFDRFRIRTGFFNLFQKRIVSCATYAVNPRYGGLCLFHPSDWAHFGLTEDVRKLWNIPEANESELMRWFELHPPDWGRLARRLDRMSLGWQKRLGAVLASSKQLQSDGFACRFAPEQYLWIEALRNEGYMEFRDCLDICPENLVDSERSLINNFVILQARNFGIRSLKYDILREERHFRLHTHIEWARLYSKSTGQSVTATANDWITHARMVLGRMRELSKPVIVWGF